MDVREAPRALFHSQPFRDMRAGLSANLHYSAAVAAKCGIGEGGLALSALTVDRCVLCSQGYFPPHHVVRLAMDYDSGHYVPTDDGSGTPT